MAPGMERIVVRPSRVRPDGLPDAMDGKSTMSFHLLTPRPLSHEDGAEEGWGQSLDHLATAVRR
ncbi:hypothetical protein OHB12_35545 [Nocardia sp. NBC_01730]|uniref:hypothetical protein n=1 Tax=Nocardia sp. NBC_01730 TaxID=2975998 RepID=UPI002E145C66|nr:hypothetical protein OHB12_35545 [Nocardia sp. NBC_01730]